MSSIIKEIEKGSPASKTRLAPGDRLLTVNGHAIRDVLDYKYYTYESKLTVEYESRKGKLKTTKIRKGEGEDAGIIFEDYLMDNARSCANKCVFCFVDQLPHGMRETLYFKDDDARLSFLLGNYITLTNLSKREIQRIIDLRVSPVNISVHATDPELRRMMLGSRRGGECMDIMRSFAEAGITMNCQIVCCPGINDGAELDRSMADLAGLYPRVDSVSIVPVGLTKHREGLCELSPFDREGAGKTIAQVDAFAEACLEKYGSRIFFCSDEMYLKAETPLPSYDYYEGFPQLENGVGMLRLFESEFYDALDARAQGTPQSFSVGTGVSAAPFIEKLLCTAAEKYGNIKFNVYAVVNDFFGHTIDVSGLVTGGDMIAQLKGRELGDRLLIPGNMLRHGEGVFLDDVTLEEVSKELGVPVIPVYNGGAGLLETVFDYRR